MDDSVLSVGFSLGTFWLSDGFGSVASLSASTSPISFMIFSNASFSFSLSDSI